MEKKILLFMIACVCSFSLSAQRMLNLFDGLSTDQMEQPTVKRSVVAKENGYKVTYYFTKVALIPDPVFSECEQWILNGFSSNNTPGEPAYPYCSDSFSFPLGYKATVKITNCEWITVPTSPSPARQPLLMSDTIGYTIDNIVPIKKCNEYVPSQIVESADISTYRDCQILNVGITPVQFNVVKKEAKVCKTLEYEVAFERDGRAKSNDHSASGLYNTSDDPYLSHTTIRWNKEDAEQLYGGTQKDVGNKVDLQRESLLFEGLSEVEPKKYLIVSVPSYKSVVDKFASWKKTLGFDVVTVYKESWSSDEIKSVIGEVPNLSYLLLVGNNSQIPGTYNLVANGNPTKSVISDLEYACKSGNSAQIIPDICYGRLPVNNLSEATHVLSKIVTYEQNYYGLTDSFYNSHLFISKFLGRKTVATMRNSQTSFELSDYVKSLGKSVSIMFQADDDQTPLYWSDYGPDEAGVIVDPAPVPEFLRKPTYEWTVKQNEILNKINEGCAHVFYFAHGNETGWIGPWFNVASLAGLYNKVKTPIVYSMACKTGNFEEEGCFAEKFLTSANGGSVALFGFTDNTYVAYTDVIALALFNGIYPYPGVSALIKDKLDGVSAIFTPDNQPAYELGLLHKLAITKMKNNFPNTSTSHAYKEYEARMLTLFGDPSMRIILPEMVSQKSFVSKCDNGDYVISTEDTTSLISVYDVKNDKVRNFAGNVIISGNVDLSEYKICVHSIYSKPKVIDVEANSVPTENEEERCDVVEDGRLWRYFSPVNCNMEPSENIFLNLGFYGTTSIDGKTYHNCFVWKDEEKFSPDNSALIAYMREEQGKVYVRYREDAVDAAFSKGIDIVPYSVLMSELKDDLKFLAHKEIEIFDSTLSVGDTLCTSDDQSVARDFTLASIDVFECLGRNFRNCNFEDGYESYSFCTGIGDLYSLLPLPGTTSISYGVDSWKLQKVVDKDGNVIFDIDCMGKDVVSMTDKETVSKETYYDINGFEIHNPEKSGVYIRRRILDNGQVRTKKIIVR